MLRRDLRVAFANGEGLRRLHETLEAIGEFLEIHGTLPCSRTQIAGASPAGRAANPGLKAANIRRPLNGDIARGRLQENAKSPALLIRRPIRSSRKSIGRG